MLSRLLLLPVALAMASPTGTHARSEADSDNPLELLLRYHHEPGSNQTEFSLSTPDKTEFYAHACGDTFEVAGKTVTMSVNERGSGNLVVDDKEYKVVGDRKVSGGVSCTKMYNDQSTVVECSIPWRASFEDLEAQSDDVAECFSGESAARRRSLPSTFGPPLSTSSDVEKRQAGACAWYYHDNTNLVGDGDPHQDTLHKQVGPSQTCAQKGNCYVAKGEEVSVTIEAEIGGAGPWMSGGFGVSKTRSSSIERGCYGDVGDTVCQWVKTHHTAYTVTTTTRGQCGPFSSEKTSDPYVIRSPNSGSMAIEWYCVVNTCRGPDDRYWELGRAGGP